MSTDLLSHQLLAVTRDSGLLRSICAELAKVSEKLPRTPRGTRDPAPRFSEMLNNVRTAETMGVQLWLKRPLSQLGGPSDRGVGIAYPQLR